MVSNSTSQRYSLRAGSGAQSQNARCRRCLSQRLFCQNERVVLSPGWPALAEAIIDFDQPRGSHIEAAPSFTPSLEELHLDEESQVATGDLFGTSASSR